MGLGGPFLLVFFLLLQHESGVVEANLADCLHLETPNLSEHVRVDPKVEGFAVSFQHTFSLASPFVTHRYVDYLPPSYKVITLTSEIQFFEKLSILDLILSSLGVTGFFTLPSSLSLSSLPPLKSFSYVPSYKHKFYLLPSLPTNLSLNRYNCYLLHPDFYLNIPVPHLLIYQSDSLVIQKDDGNHDTPDERRTYLRDFYRFPYLGAPWKWRKCEKLPFGNKGGMCRDGGNGGLSYRRVSAMVDVTSSRTFGARVDPRTGYCSIEDIVISNHMNQNASLARQLAPREEAKLFSVETMHTTTLPWGFHKVWAHDPGFRHPDAWILEKLHVAGGKSQKHLFSWAEGINLPKEFEIASKALFGPFIGAFPI